MANTGWVLVVACVIALVASQSCPDQSPQLSKWSEDATWNGQPPAEGDALVIENGDNILLDTSPPRLNSITIESGGKLVVADGNDISLTVKYILVRGEMHVGSEDCPFTGKLHITLEGNLGEYSVAGFGEKFIGVAAGGVLEIHGEYRLPWTKLTSNVDKVEYISNVKVNDTVVYIKGTCLASMKKDRYTVYLCLTVNNGDTSVQYAYCQCPIGLAQPCSHIGGLLFALNGKHRLKCPNAEESCTSQLCQWVVPRNQNQSPKQVSELTFAKPQLDSEPTRVTSIDFDPRHPQDRSLDMQYTLDQLKDLKKIFPNTGLTHLWHIPDDVPEAAEEVTVNYEVDPRNKEMEKLIYKAGNVPPLIIDDELVEYIEFTTRGQRLCPVWTDLHRGRITSSIFGQVLKAGSSPNSLIKHIIEGSGLQKYSSLPPAVKWDQDHEMDAKRQYIALKSVFGDVMVKETGLTLCSTHSFLGASGDGRVHDAGEEGVLEIKCPFSLKGKPVHKMEIQDILNLKDPALCLIEGNDGPRLRQDHDYYAQVQGEMALMGLPWCDFVVWTSAKCGNIFIERIFFDAEFVRAMMPKLVAFYSNYVIPKLTL